MTCSNGRCIPICVAPWSPSWKQTASAGAFWAEFEVFGGSLPRSVSLEVPGDGPIPLSLAYGDTWSAGLDGVASGTTVILHATDVTGATAQTVPFRYLVDGSPLTDQCQGTPSTSPACTPLARGMVSFTMDDSYDSQDLLARPLLTQYGMRATIYHITNQLSSYGLLPNAQSLAAAGNEVGSHTRTHPDLTGVSAAQLDDELGASKQYLLDNVGSPVESFATPMGSYNATVLAAIKTYYGSHRTVNPGLNYMGNDVYELNADGVYDDSTVAQVCAQLSEAAANKGWRILVFHDFTTAATSDQDLLYPIASFEGILRCAQSTPGLDVVTVREGVQKLRCASP
jgi:peptidoglycan/xylan/chitin deacetylase (PgdA/CDA1 family)